MNPPKVSIVVATYNYGQYLAQALDSILAQSTTDWEAVIVDDGSTDDTPRVVDKYAADPRFRYHRLQHAGQPAAKNAGIGLARGVYVAFLDADDAWLPEKLAKQTAIMDADAGVGVSYTRRYSIDERNVRLSAEELTPYRGEVLPQMFLNNFVCFSSSMVRRSVFDDVGAFDEQIPLAIDYDLWLRVALRYRFDFVDEPLVEYRTGHANLSTRAEERFFIVLEIMKRFLDERGGRAALPSSLVRRAFAETYCSLALVQRRRSTSASLQSYLRALAQAPLRVDAWRGVASLAIPEPGRRALRRLLGRPVDWSRPALETDRGVPASR